MKDFREWYVLAYGDGRFTYATDWTGFNVPSRIVRKVRDEFIRHTKLEKRLLSALDEVGAFSERHFYVIGTSQATGEDGDVIRHEVRHGLYYCKVSYRRAVKKALAESDNRRLREFLRVKGYCEGVLDDEVQAYALTGWPSGYEPGPEDELLSVALKRVEKRYF